MSFDQREYNRRYYRENAERIKANVRARYAAKQNDPSFKAVQKAEREERHFGLPREVIFRKTDGACYYCGKPAEVVHHLDDDGRNHEAIGLDPGRDPSRLVPACRACHMIIHRHKLQLGQKTRARGFWSRNFERCIECGTTDRKHYGHGLCVNCAARARRKGGGV
jgi:hypothetical protein